MNDRAKTVELFLLEEGFKCFGTDNNRDAFLFQKKISTEFNLSIWEHSILQMGTKGVRYELEIFVPGSNQPPGFAKYYGIGPEDLIENLEVYANKLLKAARYMMYNSTEEYKDNN